MPSVVVSDTPIFNKSTGCCQAAAPLEQGSGWQQGQQGQQGQGQAQQWGPWLGDFTGLLEFGDDQSPYGMRPTTFILPNGGHIAAHDG